MRSPTPLSGGTAWATHPDRFRTGGPGTAIRSAPPSVVDPVLRRVRRTGPGRMSWLDRRETAAGSPSPAILAAPPPARRTPRRTCRRGPAYGRVVPAGPAATRFPRVPRRAQRGSPVPRNADWPAHVSSPTTRPTRARRARHSVDRRFLTVSVGLLLPSGEHAAAQL